MFDNDSIGDPDLDRLERRLRGIMLTPAVGQRERYLFACGQAAGRTTMLRRVRAVTAVAAGLACVSAGLGAALLNQRRIDAVVVAPMAIDRSIASQVVPPSTDHPVRVLPSDGHQRQVARGDQLTAASGFTDWLIVDRDPPGGRLQLDASNASAERVLTASDWRSLSDL